MATVVSQHIRNLNWSPSQVDFFKSFIFEQLNCRLTFLKIVEKHVLTFSNWNIIKNKVEKEKLELISSKTNYK